ncbi:hypothetical protein niasHS_008682 [Heterodera schachtii]|uniref:Uncharacterized protein n=1 Tax=Heterodera schachtii TaxID=97005 RepID=A0ABD2JAS1_HETSC
MCDIIRRLCCISKFYFDDAYKKHCGFKAINALSGTFGGWNNAYAPKMANEQKFNMEMRRKSDDDDEDSADNLMMMALRKEFDEMLKKLANEAKKMANDKTMVKKEKLVRDLLQGHPFLKEKEKLMAKNGTGIANDKKPKEKPTKKQSLPQNGKKFIIMLPINPESGF